MTNGGRTGNRWRSFAVAAAALGLTPAGIAFTALAQGVDCAALEAQRAALMGEARAADRSATDVARQRAAIARTQAYADASGCGAEAPFADEPSPECLGIAARLGRMRQDLRATEAEGGGADSDVVERRRALDAQIEAYCTGSWPAPRDGAADVPPGRPVDDGEPRIVPLDPDGVDPPTLDEPQRGPDGASPAAPASKALCVRRCDGGFFPITDRATADQVEGLGQLCQALCPNAEAILYTTAPSGDLSTAVASDGTPYTALATAFKFAKSYDATCSCKPPHRTWAEALAMAEQMIAPDKADVTVTAEMSAQMARAPAAAAFVPDAGKHAKVAGASRKTARRARDRAPPVAPPQTEAGAGSAPLD